MRKRWSRTIAGMMSALLLAGGGIGQVSVHADEKADGSAANTAAAEDSANYSKYSPGVTVVQDDSSPTGYNVIFVFDEKSIDSSKYGLKDIAGVEVYSDGMFLFDYDEQAAGTALDPGTVGSSGEIAEKKNAHDPAEFKPGMYPAGGDTKGELYGSKKIAYYQKMEEFADGLWGTTIPLTSGATYYNYRLTDSDGTRDNSYIDDPANPAMVNTTSGIKSRSSMVYVPYSGKQGTVEWADRSVENPRTDGQTGTVTFDSYTGAKGDTRYLGVYLPYRYNPERTKPYNVLYLSHGAQTEQQGCELRWLNECAAANIFDNEGIDYIVVTMNNTDMDGWNINSIWSDQQKIMEHIEAAYNVGKSPENRAYAGFSMGGITASRMYAYHADQFKYFGIWSGALDELGKETAISAAERKKLNNKISLAAGDWDYLLGLVNNFKGHLDSDGIDSEYFTVPGSHDWRTWAAILSKTAKNFFFTEEETDAPDTSDYSGFDPGVTVEEDADSPTGYTATFIYKQADNYEGLNGTPVKVELYSDCMLLFDPEAGYTSKDYADHAVQPEDYKKGLMPGGGSGNTTYYKEMVNLGEGLWGARVPLSSGAFVYNFQVTDADGNKKSRLDDPSNPTLTNSATGIHSLSSMVYVPYNAEKEGTGEFTDRTVENRRTDGRNGTVETISYTGAAGDTRGLAVYLPYGYDADRDEPYKVLYLSHGASGDKVGNELRWMNEGAVANIMDNLEGDFVVVTMNNQDLGWNYDKIWAEQELIMDQIEYKYNVRDDAAGRAFCGLSMGGFTTSNMLINHPDEFSYYGIWSYANVNGLTDEVLDKLSAMKDDIHIMTGAGQWDFLLGPVNSFSDKLAGAGISYTKKIVPGAHDWETWQLLYADAVQNFLFKDDDTTFEGYKDGVTVEEDAKSPTGYTATFIYKQQDSYEGLSTDPVKVELYSDCMLLFDPEAGYTASDYAGHAITPEDYEAGLMPGGGNGSTTYYKEMKYLGNGRWGARVPLSSGAFVYNFQVTDADGNKKSRLDDPSNPTLTNSATGIHSLSSMVYVPYNSEKEGSTEFADKSVENPRTDGKNGRVETIGYTGAAGDLRGLAVYLPYGYDADRAEPYKVLYLSHGASGDKVGNELRWMNEGAVANIMDNLEGDFVVVTMNNQDLGWNYDRIWAEQELIMDRIEKDYNVRDDAKGKAFAGLSMGGITTSNMLMNHPDEFSYYGIWSAANTKGLTDDVMKMLADKAGRLHVMAGGGQWDFGLASAMSFGETLDKNGYNVLAKTVPGAHDWETWQEIYAYAVQNFFWKAVGEPEQPEKQPEQNPESPDNEKPEEQNPEETGKSAESDPAAGDTGSNTGNADGKSADKANMSDTSGSAISGAPQTGIRTYAGWYALIMTAAAAVIAALAVRKRRGN